MTSSTRGSYFLASTLLAFFLISFGCWSSRAWALTELDDRELSTDEVLDTKPLIGLKPGDEKMFAVDERTHQAGVPFDLFLDSMDKLGLDDWKQHVTVTPGTAQAYMSADWTSTYKVANDNRSGINASGYSGSVWGGAKQRVGLIDAALVPSLVTWGVFGDKPHLYLEKNVPDAPLLMSGDYASIKTLKWAYSRLQREKPDDALARAMLVADAYAALKVYPMLRQSVEVKVGQVTFGKPLVFSAADKHLTFPTEWLKQYRVYWIQLALTLHDLVADEITELTFLVSTPQDCIAAELAPIKVEKESETKRTLKIPEVNVEVGGIGVSVGSILGEEVTFKSLIPTLIANGLQENDFSWSMMDEAIRRGSQRFVVVLLIPKAQKKVDMKFQVNARTKSWFTQGDVLTTEPSIATIELH